MAKQRYQPPEQSKFGQLIDSLFLLVLVLASLFVPVYFGLASGGKTTLDLPTNTWAGLGQNATMQAQWEKLGYTPETAHELIATRFDYSFSIPALVITALVVIAYFVFVFRWSAKEYKDVIAERFDR
ncbi:MAG: hypothetical protein WC829_05070 [Hyphomicrobium sp.]|jgi:hypothetical protein